MDAGVVRVSKLYFTHKLIHIIIVITPSSFKQKCQYIYLVIAFSRTDAVKIVTVGDCRRINIRHLLGSPTELFFLLLFNKVKDRLE